MAYSYTVKTGGWEVCEQYLYISTTFLNILCNTVSHVNEPLFAPPVFPDDWACFSVVTCSKFCWTLSFHLGNRWQKMYAIKTMSQQNPTISQTSLMIKNFLSDKHSPKQYCFNYQVIELWFLAHNKQTTLNKIFFFFLNSVINRSCGEGWCARRDLLAFQTCMHI